jgi:hypothetical protein
VVESPVSASHFATVTDQKPFVAKALYWPSRVVLDGGGITSLLLKSKAIPRYYPGDPRLATREIFSDQTSLSPRSFKEEANSLPAKTKKTVKDT